MRIALVSHTSLYWTRLYATALTERGHVVRVMSFSEDSLEGLDVVHIGNGMPRRLAILAYLARVPRLASQLRSFAPDVVLATYLSSNGLAAALCRPRRLVLSAHGTDVFGTPGGARLHRRMMRFACCRADAVHAVSQPLADVLTGYGVPADRIHVFPIGIDVDTFTRPSGADRPASRPPRIVSTRRQERVYGNDTIIRAAAILRDEGVEVRATLLGGGPLLAANRELVARLGLEAQVGLPGQLPSRQVLDTLQTSDIYVSASSSDGASSSLLEALACGLFPIVSAIPANTAWLEDGVTALFFDVGDERGLADALRRALSDEALRASARALNRARVADEGNIATNMGRMESLLTEVGRAGR
jgi:glycosyltransferase involved in cell wall biosynthesis